MIFKNKFKISFWSLCSILFFFSCDNEPYEGLIPVVLEDNLACQEAIKKVSDAAIRFNFANDFDYSELCGVYKSALQNQINVCGDENGVLQDLWDSLGNCIKEVIVTTECGNFTMNQVYEEPIICDYALLGKLQVVHVYMEGKDFLSDKDEDGEIDHYGKLLYVTDGTVVTNSQDEFISYENNTYILELLLESKGTERLIPGMYRLFGSKGLDSSKESFLGGGHFGSKLSTFDKFQNGVVYLNEVDGEYELCFDILIDENNNCFMGNYDGGFEIVYF